MGRVFDFAKRRIVGYIVYWILVLLFLGIFYPADPPAQAGALVILAIAFLGSLLFTRRMKRKQKARREAEDRVKQMQEAYQMQQMTRMQAPQPPVGQAQVERAQLLEATRRAGGRGGGAAGGSATPTLPAPRRGSSSRGRRV